VKPVAVVAVGGNSLVPQGERGSFSEQRRHARLAGEAVAAVLGTGYRVVVTHGNGPQVGQLLLRGEKAQAELPAEPLDACVAETQGGIGYLLVQAIVNAFEARKIYGGVVAMITQVLVDPEDPAFALPTKPVGPFFSPEEALERERTLGWCVGEDAGRGWRRRVASPRPVEIVELESIRAGLDAGATVVAAGGGGIPVTRNGEGGLTGVEAVIDKDRASAVLARALEAELLLFLTDVDRVAWHFGQAGERWLERLDREEAKEYLDEGEFPAGSMGPKIESALDFLDGGGQSVIVTSAGKAAAALSGKAGTWIEARGVGRRPMARVV
jgi:carbamate kinase